MKFGKYNDSISILLFMIIMSDINQKDGHKGNANVGQNQQGSQVDLADEFANKDLEVSWLRWKCLNCGYVYEGTEPVQKCPKCGNDDPDKFEDVD